MSLFNSGDFTLHAGGKSDFIIDCNALTDEDLDALAKKAAGLLGEKYRYVVGIPQGGARFAHALIPYVRDPLAIKTLIVDDVYTTGTSMREAAEAIPFNQRQGVVIFARSLPFSWVLPLFRMASNG